MKQSDTNAIANLYVESINRGADPSKVSNETYSKICDMVEKLKKQGVSLEDAKYRIADSLEYPENTDDLGHTIERVWGITDTIGDRKYYGDDRPNWGWGKNSRIIPSDPDNAPSALRSQARARGERPKY
tara:strand:+ start:2667 stop:3053 length:387 start_codon:yes stop_codon:yes gene_type:complete